MHDSMNSTLFCCWVLLLNFCWTVSLVARAISSHYYNIFIIINISCSRYLLDRQSMHAGHWAVLLAHANSVPNKYFSILFCVWLVSVCAVRIKMRIQSCIPTIWWTMENVQDRRETKSLNWFLFVFRSLTTLELCPSVQCEQSLYFDDNCM